jgi:hypothetical protein
MKTYAVNLSVDTKTTDIYDKVSINKYPIIVICEGEKELWDKLSSSDTISWVKHNVKNKRLFDSAYFYIREIDKDIIKEICWKTDSLMSIEY